MWYSKKKKITGEIFCAVYRTVENYIILNHLREFLLVKLKPHFGEIMNEDEKCCGSFNQEQDVYYNAETDCIDEDDSWFFNFTSALTLDTEPSLPVKEVRKSVLVDFSDRRSSPRTEKLTRSTAGKQTHLKPQIISGRLLL
jgi:hypothetical protein